MQHGDIGDAGRTHSVRVALVWEGCCASRPAQHPTARERFARIRGGEENWARVVRSWTIYDKPLQRIHALQTRGVPVDVWTFEGEEFCDALRDHLEHLYVEVSRVEYFESVDSAARALRVSPEVQYVVDSDRARLALWGRRGLAVKLGDDWGQFL